MRTVMTLIGVQKRERTPIYPNQVVKRINKSIGCVGGKKLVWMVKNENEMESGGGEKHWAGTSGVKALEGLSKMTRVYSSP